MSFPLREYRPIPPRTSDPPGELQDEAALVLHLSLRPMDPALARAYARRKYLIYFFIAAFGLGLPASVIGVTALSEWGLSRGLAQLLIALLLAGFFIFFFAMIGLIASRGKIHPYLGIQPAEGAAEATAADVAVVAERHDRTLEYGIAGNQNFWRCATPFPAFEVQYRHGGFHAAGATPPAVERLLSGIPPHRHWRDLAITGGPSGVQTTRPVRLAKYYLHDLWLLEKILATAE